MEGFKNQEKILTEEKNGETRNEKIKMAERNVFSIFENKLAEVLDRVGENPYFRDLENSF